MNLSLGKQEGEVNLLAPKAGCGGEEAGGDWGEGRCWRGDRPREQGLVVRSQRAHTWSWDKAPFLGPGTGATPFNLSFLICKMGVTTVQAS